MFVIHAVDCIESRRNMQRVVGPTHSFIEFSSWFSLQPYDGWTIFLGL